MEKKVKSEKNKIWEIILWCLDIVLLVLCANTTFPISIIFVGYIAFRLGWLSASYN